MGKKLEFAHLHTHTDHSVLDGHAQVGDLVNHVFQQGQPGLAFTDHGTMTNVYNGWKAVQSIKKEHGVDFFFMPGIEAYVAPGETHRSIWEPVFFSSNSREDKAERSNDVSGGGAYTHLTMLAETSEGMHNLFKLNTMAWHDGQFRKPRMDLESISQHAKGLIATTACPSGELQTRIRLGQLKEAMAYASKMQDIFGKENYFLELMDHNMSIDLERKVRGDLMRIAKELKIPLLATNDLHYTKKEDALSHEHMLCIQSGSSMSELPYDLGGKRFAFGGEEYYAKSTDEMLRLFPDDQYPDAIQNSAEIVKRATATFEYDPSLRPTVDMPDGHDEDSYLRELVMEGLHRKVPAKTHDREYLDRIDKELGILSERRFSSYMLVVSDFTRWAKRQGFYCGPGRGCLSGDTLIPTLDGNKQLRDIKIGDVAFDENGMQIKIPAVYEWDCDEGLLEITSSNGSPIKMTTDHKVLVLSSKDAAKGSKETKWIPANEINIGDFVVMPKLATSANENVHKGDFTYFTVTKIQMVPAEGKVYDFRVDSTMSYATESFVVHNSGGGSLVAFLTDITEIDPIPHGLIFERFLNPERDSPPDIDSDFDDVNREKVIAYVRDKYGDEMVAMIITFGTIKAKQAMKDIARIYEEPYSVGETLTKAMPDPVGGKEITLREAFDPTAARYPEAEEFRRVANSLDNPNIIPYARGIEGRMRQTGVHAAGVIMSSKPLKNVIPLMMRKKDGVTITQFDYPTCEDLGLIKMDFLGLRNLTVISKAIDSIEKNHGIKLVAEEIYGSVLTNPDEKTFEFLRTGKTLGVFQLDSGGISNLVKMINVTEFNDISAILALYRPGPMGMNSHIAYADRKNGREPVTPIHPELAEVLEPILGSTYQLCCYQEQIQFIAQQVSTYSLGEADVLRRAMGKKKKSEMDAQWSKFSEGALGRGYSLEAIQTLWDALVPFAEYGFNKSHSAAYALISYLTAYLKANYPAEFMAANLSTLVGDKDKTSLYLHECSQMGIEVLPPSVSHSTPDYTPTPDGKILFGLQGIRGVGFEVAESIHAEVVENGAFTDINDFLNRAPASALKTSALEGFAHGGALDGLGLSRRTLYKTLPEVARGFAQSRRKKDSGQFSLFDDVEDSGGVSIEFDDLPEYTKKDKLMFERHMLGLYVSDHPLSGMANMLDNYSDYKIAQIAAGEVAVGGGGFGSERKKIRIAGVANAVQKKLTRKGQMMGIFEIQDITGTIPCLIFPSQFDRMGHKLNNDSIYEVTGSLMAKDGEEIQFAVDDLREITLTEAGKVPFSINLMLSQASEDALQDLERLLMDFPGEMPVYLNVKNSQGEIMIYELDEKYSVNASSYLNRSIQALFGLNSIPK